MRERVKITDLAKELGVSTTTISRALSNEGRIGAKTKASVLELAKKWGYKPNPFAVNLLKKKSKMIGLIVPEFTHHYFARVLNGVNKVVNDNGYQLIINIHQGSRKKEEECINLLSGMRVDGIIASYARETANFDHYLDAFEDNVPLVFVDRMCEDLDTSYVISDDFDGCIQSINQLVKSGSKKIAHIAGPENLSTSFTRLMGYKEGLKINHLEENENLILSSDDPSWKLKLEKLIDENEVDGVLAYTDYVAFDITQMMLNAGKRVPEDLAIIGFADEPIAQHMTPKLSTIQQPAELMGARAAEILMWHIENPDSAKVFCESLPTELINRETTVKKKPVRKLQSSMKLLAS
ncbi:MAG: LacI family DNA-binding transcriptional regulator [Reichenbachiella sp.]